MKVKPPTTKGELPGAAIAVLDDILGSPLAGMGVTGAPGAGFGKVFDGPTGAA